MKVIFMGTPEFAVSSLEALHERCDEVLLVICQEDKPKGRGKKMQFPPVKEKALEYGYEVFQPKKIKEEESVNYIKSFNPDIIVVTAYGQILPKEILEFPKYGCVNVHASLLPEYRGAAPINYVLIDGKEETGITTMIMEEGLDTGDMLIKKSLKIENEDTAVTLSKKLSNLGKEILIETLNKIENNEIKPEKQDNSKSSYAHMMKKDLGHINWEKDSSSIINLWRGTDPWPGVYSYYKENTVKLFNIQKSTGNGKPGEILDVRKEGIIVATCDGAVIIKEIQFPNKKRMQVSEYLKGNNIEIGEILK